ncbi:MAG: hypothetical protein IJU52_03875 [Clostridia bacterium]|nr:hypothetical protein [Clostridia bacterium]
MNLPEVIYYTDELNDEFSPMTLTPPVIDASYRYTDDRRSKKAARFFLYRFIAYPAAFLWSKCVFMRKIVGKEKLKAYRHTGYFLYGNHTQPTGDALMQACLTWPETNYVIVHPNNLVVPVIGRFTPALGALPLPGDMGSYRNFKKAIAQRSGEGHPIVVYPEAHIWPYYTGIRPFPDTSFSYPVELGKPSFCFVNTYRKRRFSKRPKIVTYIEGPFFPEDPEHPRAARKALRDRIYRTMTDLASRSDVEMIKYIKKEP